MNEVQIRHMVSRFLGWKLPDDFSPDGGITFDPIGNKDHPDVHVRYKREPTGTNLFDGQQAEAMVRYLIEGLPTSEDPFDWEALQRLRKAS